jgi:uncharacterized protein YfaS (alpha-2-macroglobulin family)
MRRTLVVLVMSLLFLSSSVFAQEAPKVSGFTPQGTVKKVRQVWASFSEPMVAFGDPRAAAPFAVQCSEEGRGRWADPGTWVYDFERDLPGGIRCSFKLTPDLRTLSGKALAGKREFSFSTGGPAIRNSLPYAGNRGIGEDQVFILGLDSVADEASVLAGAGFVIAGIQQRVGAQIVTGAEREAILAAHRWLFNSEPDRGKYVLLQCRQRFPQKSKVSLVWGKGIASASGVATEQDQVLNFETREAFLAEFSCERESPRAGCIPVLAMRLHFNAALDPGQTGAAVLKGPDGKTWSAPLGKDGSLVTFEGPLPANADFLLEIPAGIKDDAGRALTNANRFPLKVRTAGYPPLAKFAARFGIVELNADPALPVTIRNIEPQPKARMLKVEAGTSGQVTGKIVNVPPGRAADVQPWLRRVAAAKRDASLFAADQVAEEFKIPKTLGPGAFEVVGIPLKKPGLYIVEIESAILGKALLDAPKPMYMPAAVLVTNLSVHFKHGRESSLVWVTTLDQAEPVAGADVAVMDCAGKVLWKGRTDADGIARIDAELAVATDNPACTFELPEYDTSQLGALRRLGEGLFITAETGGDMSFVHSSWDEGIEAWRFKLPAEYGAGPVIAHTIFDRSLLRAGETVYMKHLIRRHTMDGFAVPLADRLPDTASIRHAGSKQAYELPLTWDASGVAETDWAIPKEAKLGSYSVTLMRKSSPQSHSAQSEETGEDAGEESNEFAVFRSLTSGRFRVEEFRLPLLKGTIQPPSQPLVNAKEAVLDLSVQYLAGGGAGLLPVKLRADVAAKRLPAFEGFDDFVFGNGPVKEGLVRRGEQEDTGEGSGGPKPKLMTVDLVLDSAGTARTVVPGLPAADAPQDMTAEMEFRDPNGEIQTVSSRVPLWNAGRLIGIKPDSWAVSQEALKFQTAVVDLSGRPVAGAPVKVDLFERKVISHRKRLVGGFYAYDHTVEIKRIETLIEGKTDAKGLLLCDVPSPLSGEVILVAESRDASGNRTFANRSVWVAGKSEWWFEAADHDRMDLLAERKRYEPGESAVFQVRMPFREATVLISVEREGVLDTWVRKISGREPVVEIPIKGNYAPNVFISVLAVRGRTGAVQPTAMADLGKPAFKLGMAEINVGWRAHELKVTLTTDRRVYNVREKVKVTVRAATADGKVPPAGSEVALVAVDEGLLELMANKSWDLLPALMGRRGYEVQTATAQMQVVGKRHFGIKALPQGGGGGRQATRELLDTLLLWKARLPLNELGEAEIEVPLNDAITSFRIVAAATGGTHFFGTGAVSIQSTQDLMVFSGLPPLVREGDRFRAGVTVRNTSRQIVAVEVSARAAGISPVPAPQTVSLAAGEARELFWDVTVPSGAQEVAWEIDAAAKETAARDRLRVVQHVAPAVPLRVFQASLKQLDGRLALSVARPADALAGGGVRVSAQPRLGDGLSAVADAMRRYPYGCMEQKISVAVALRDQALWERWVAQIPSYMDADGLVKYFPSTTHGDPVLTAYILAISHEAGWIMPEALRHQATQGLKRFVDGSLVRYSLLPTADLAIRKLAALEALSRYGEAEPKLLGSIAVDPNLWPTSAVIDWVGILLNMPALPNRAERLAQAEQVLRARLTYQGTVMAFSTEASDRLWWLMVSNDVNAVRLVLTALRLDAWQADMPRLARGALARQRAGCWDLTTANAWGVLAMERFSQKFETEPVTGTTRVDLAGQSRAFDWVASPKGDAALLAWPAEKAELDALHQGMGKPWLTVQSLAAIPLKEALSSGYSIRKTVSAVDRKAPERWSRGDIVRVRLEIEAQADMTWVAVSDPVPAGATILGTGLGRDSRILTQGEERKGRVWPVYEERSFEAFRAYYEVVPKGTWSVEYTLRLNQSGSFQLPPTRVEALYAPEMMGEIPNAEMVVEP